MLNEEMSAELAQELAENNVKRLVDPRSLPMRFSLIKHIAKSPAHLFAAAQGSFDKDTEALRIGRAADAYAIGDEDSIAVWDKKTATGRMSPRTGKDWDAFCAKHAGKDIITAKEELQARAIARALRRHERAAEMLYSGGTQLHPELEWTYNGRKFVSHLDAYRKGAFVIDVKTCVDGEPSRFSRAAIWQHYHTQAAMYVTAVESLGHPTPDAYLVVVEKVDKAGLTEPFAVTIMRFTARALERGRAQFHTWFERLQQCEAAGFWPAYAQDVIELDIPDADEPFAGLTYQGEEIEL
jgi:hypothetical protein